MCPVIGHCPPISAQFRAEMSQWKEAFMTHYKTARCLEGGNEKGTEVEMYMYIQRSYQNLPCMGWAKTESISTVLKVSVDTKLYWK